MSYNIGLHHRSLQHFVAAVGYFADAAAAYSYLYYLLHIILENAFLKKHGLNEWDLPYVFRKMLMETACEISVTEQVWGQSR